MNQASTDLNRYIGIAADNMVYDKTARTYIRGSQFEPLFLTPEAGRYLSQLRSVADGILDRTDAWIGQFPLKARGYRWSNGEDGRPKAWFRDVDDADLAAEERFLADEIYGGQPRHHRSRIDFRNRFSDRE